MEPSSATSGFFQDLPQLPNQYYDDVSVQRILKLFVSSELRNEVESEFAELGNDVISEKVLNYVTDAEHNTPVSSWKWARRIWPPNERFSYGRGLAQIARYCNHVWEASSATTTCPGAMTDGAARLMQRHLSSKDLDPIQRRVFQDAYDRLTSNDPEHAWTSGQWMTERPGGSDVSRTESVATLVETPNDNRVDTNGMPLGPWEINGFKWFSSATDSNMTVLLAQTPQGLSTFFAPMRRRVVGSEKTELNGVQIQRLKEKFGTRPLPTAELELRGMRAWLVGRPGNGIREIATLLSITRVHSAVACLGNLGRGLSVAKAFSRIRKVSAGPGGRSHTILVHSQLHMRTLARMTGEYHGMMLLAAYTAYTMGVEERINFPQNVATIASLSSSSFPLHPPELIATPLLRALSSLHKAYICRQSIPLLYGACMESLGGVGYLLNHESEHLNTSRLFRDACVNSIWEGTTDVLSTDLARTLTHPKSGPDCLDALEWLVVQATKPSTSPVATTLVQRWKAVRARYETGSQSEAANAVLLADARGTLFEAAELIIASLLLYDAFYDGARASTVMCQRFLESRGFTDCKGAALSLEDGLAVDSNIVYGDAASTIPHISKL